MLMLLIWLVADCLNRMKLRLYTSQSQLAWAWLMVWPPFREVYKMKHDFYNAKKSFIWHAYITLEAISSFISISFLTSFNLKCSNPKKSKWYTRSQLLNLQISSVRKAYIYHHLLNYADEWVKCSALFKCRCRLAVFCDWQGKFA